MAKITQSVDLSSRGRVAVLIHAAGIEISRLLPDKEPAEFERVFDVKVNGWFNLLKAVGDMPLGAAPATPLAASALAVAGRATAAKARVIEQWIKEGKNAIKWTRLSCRRFKGNQVRLQLFALAYNLGNGGPTLDQRAVIDAGFLELVRLGALPADDPDVLRTLPIVDATIRRLTAAGPGWLRYNGDGYGDCELSGGNACAVEGAPWPLPATRFSVWKMTVHESVMRR